MDDKAWLKQRNLFSKIESPAHRREWLEYLRDLLKSGHGIGLYPAKDGDIFKTQPPEDFASELQIFHQDRTAGSVSVKLLLDRDASKNTARPSPTFSRRSLIDYCRSIGS